MKMLLYAEKYGIFCKICSIRYDHMTGMPTQTLRSHDWYAYSVFNVFK